MQINSRLRPAAPAVALVTLALAACAATTPPADPANAAPPAAGPNRASSTTPAAKGIEAGDVNRSVEPCADFYEYANGTWRAQNPIPTGKSLWSRRLAGREANRQKVRAIIQELAAKPDWPTGSPEQLVGDHYASCMDEPAIEAAGISPIAPPPADIDAGETAAHGPRNLRPPHHPGTAPP